MNSEFIKEELVKEVSKLIAERVVNDSNPLLNLSDRISSYGNFEEKIFEKLNLILERNNIDLQEGQEQNDLIEYLKPTIIDLIEAYERI